jgi:uncharacterized protein YidB (DUF937 family)
MGLLDILNGMQNGPRGQRDPNAKGGMSPITMAILALLAYKAYQKVGGGQATAPQPAPGRIPAGRTTEAGLPGGSGAGGGLGDLLGGLLGGGAGPGAGRNLGPGAGAAGGGLGDLLGGLLGGGAGPGAGRNLRAGGDGAGGGLDDLLKGPLGGLLAGGAAGSIVSGGLDGLLKQFQQQGLGDVADSWVGTGPNKDISESDLARSIGMDDLDALAQQTGMSRSDMLSGLRQELPDFVDQLTPDGHVPTEEEASRWA